MEVMTCIPEHNPELRHAGDLEKIRAVWLTDSWETRAIINILRVNEGRRGQRIFET